MGIYSRSQILDGPTAPDGIILYIKPACYGNEPRDIYEYFKRSGTFPHDSTADQFFSESQFGSYRMLGAHTMERLCPTDAADLRDFLRKILQDHLRTPESDWPKELRGTWPLARRES